MSKSPSEYAEIFEKTTQVEALMFSNNTGLDLSDIFEDSRLIPILEGSARIARYGFDLRHRRFDRFAHYFCGDFSLKTLGIKRTVQLTPRQDHYSAELVTFYNNTVQAYAGSLPGLMNALAKKTMNDLIAAEFSYYQQSSAHNLLMVSSKLSILGYVLNDSFIPSRMLEARNHSAAATEFSE